MAVQFRKLKVKKVKRETHDSVSLTFKIPAELKNEFVYKSGQYLTIKVPVDDKNNRRAYSISSSPFLDEDITVTIKKLDMGLVSVYLNDKVTEGDELEVMPPLGHFTLDFNPNASRDLVLFAGGSGITPLYSIMRSMLHIEENSRVLLFYANRKKEGIIYSNELHQLEKQYPDRLKIVYSLTEYDDNWNGFKGRFNKSSYMDIINQIVANKVTDAEYFLCGPYGMMLEAETAMDSLGVPIAKIHKESFTAPQIDETSDEQQMKIQTHKELVTRKIRVAMYGEEAEFFVEPDETITSAAQRNGIDAPVSCQIGACCTCVAKVRSGKVYMDERESLTDEEIANGFILACQSHPLTDDVFVDFDNFS